MKGFSIGILAAMALWICFAQNAFAARQQHGLINPKVHFKVKKNQNQFGGKYMAPKKQHRPTGYYRSTLTGKTVYGKPKPQ
jgi:Skp family chaperone for outer membrane proteins